MNIWPEMNKDHLYDVWTHNEFVMRAPLTTIAAVYSLKKEAVRRILHEVSETGACELSSSRHSWRSIRIEWGCESWQLNGDVLKPEHAR